MFGKLGQLAGLLGNLPKIKAEMENLKERLGRLSAEGDAGGGMVRVKCSGHFQVLTCTIAPDLLSGGDRELIEDLIVAATNQALERVRRLAGEETSKIAQEIGLPPGMEIPGLSSS